MKKRINLFTKKKQEEPIPTISMTVRSYGLLFLCICAVLAVIAGGYYFYQLQTLTTVSDSVANLQVLAQQGGKIQGNIVFFINKKEQLNLFLKDDNNFQQYYTLLQGIIAQSQTDAELKSMDLTLTHDTNFVIGFKDFASAETLLNFIESPKFLGNFDALTLSSFSINNSTGNAQYLLNFRGIFVKDLAKKNEAQ